jgi:hypothetical protein
MKAIGAASRRVAVDVGSGGGGSMSRDPPAKRLPRPECSMTAGRQAATNRRRDAAGRFLEINGKAS